MLDTCGQGPPYKLSAAKVIPLNMAFNTIFISSSWVDVNSISHMTTADVTAWDGHFKPIVLLDLATRGRDQLAPKPTIIPEAFHWCHWCVVMWGGHLTSSNNFSISPITLVPLFRVIQTLTLSAQWLNAHLLNTTKWLHYRQVSGQ